MQIGSRWLVTAAHCVYSTGNDDQWKDVSNLKYYHKIWSKHLREAFKNYLADFVR